MFIFTVYEPADDYQHTRLLLIGSRSTKRTTIDRQLAQHSVQHKNKVHGETQ